MIAALVVAAFLGDLLLAVAVGKLIAHGHLCPSAARAVQRAGEPAAEGDPVVAVDPRYDRVAYLSADDNVRTLPRATAAPRGSSATGRTNQQGAQR